MMAELTVQHDKTNVRTITGTEITIRAINPIEKATEKIETEAARESRRQAESQGGTTIVGATHGFYISLGDAFTSSQPTCSAWKLRQLPPSARY
jgi:hypothetical protein